MRDWINLFETDITSKVESRAYHSGQHDLTLRFSKGSETIGWIDYVIFEDEVSIQMIHVEPQYRRQGFGTLMLRTLQREYPETEIDLGLLTQDGAALIGSMKSKEMPNGNVAELNAEKAEIEAKIARYHEMHDGLMAKISEPEFDKLRDKFIDDVADWNDLYDRLQDIEDEIGNREPTKRIFEGMEQYEVEVFHGSQKPDGPIHPRMFFSSSKHFAQSYGPHVRKFKLNVMNFVDSMDRELVEPLLPLYDPYTDSDILDWSDYEDRSSDTWEIIEDHATGIVQDTGADGIIIYEGGVKNYLVYNPRCISNA